MGEVVPPKKFAIRIIPQEEIKTRDILPKTELEKEFCRKGFSEKTAKAYDFYISKLLENAGKNSTKEINQEDLENYYFSLTEISNNTRHLIISALKHKFPKFDYSELKGGRLSKKLPDILTIEEIELLINSTENEKHKLMIKTFYSTGIRLAELVNLKYKDIYVEENAIKIFGKGSKDRFVSLAETIKDDLIKLKNIHLPNDYIFSIAGHKMSDRSVQAAIKVSVQRAKITKNIHVHSLRHAYATHLYESGVTIEKIQLLLGHENISTTMRYVRVSKKSIMTIGSPLDLLKLK